MELVLISPEADGSALAELAVLTEHCAAGLARYHVRKPGWSAGQLAAWIAAVPPQWRGRLVLHSHHELVEEYNLLGRHWPDAEVSGWSALSSTRRAGSALEPARFDRLDLAGEWRRAPADGDNALQLGDFTSCSCHRLEDLVARAGRFDSVFFGPVFVSPSKPDRPALSAAEVAAVSAYLKARSPAQRRTKVIALSGVTPERVAACRALGFDGVATMSGAGGVEGWARWVESGVRFAAEAGIESRVCSARSEIALHPFALHAVAGHIMCLTQDGEQLDHLEQAAQLCAAGAKLIQLRVKGVALPRWSQIAAAVVRICRAHGARCLINDRPDLAVAVGADGAHVGQNDGDWREARRLLGPGRLLGGTVNDVAGARRAVKAGCLDYVGVGPFRFTATKPKLAPVLGAEGVREVIAALDGLPAWAIGGIRAEDLPAVAAAGAAGVAVSSFLYRGASIAERYRMLAQAWPAASAARAELSLSAS
jgi:thiamine-phosphate pyrophosphorylase